MQNEYFIEPSYSGEYTVEKKNIRVKLDKSVTRRISSLYPDTIYARIPAERFF